MSLTDRLAQLDERERRLLGLLVIVFIAMVIVLTPLGLLAIVGSKASSNDELRDAIEAIQRDSNVVAKAMAEKAELKKRYSSKAPQLAEFLAKLAKANKLDIPESQDLEAVAHGKRYSERSNKIVLRRVGMLNLVKFMESIRKTPHPVAITRLNIQRRGSEPDSYNVTMVVSAFDRIAAAKSKPKAEASNSEESTP